MNKYYLFSALLLVVLNYSKVSIGQQKVIIEGELPEKNRNLLTIELAVYPVYYIDVVGEGREFRIPVKDGRVRWEGKIENPVFINCGSLLGRSFYLIEPGDSIHIRYDVDRVVFSGKGAEKVELVYKAKYLERHLAQPRNATVFGIDSLSDYLEMSAYVDQQIEKRNKLLAHYKMKISPFAYSYLRAELLSTAEIYRVKKFEGMNSRRRALKIEDRDLVYMFDSTVETSLALEMAKDTTNPSHALRYYLFEYTRMKYERNRLFENTLSIEKSEKVNGWYNLAKKEYKGLVRERLLSYIMTSWLIKRVGFVPVVENALDEYYTFTGYPKYKNWVRNYEIMARELVKGKKAPGFTLTEESGKKVSLQDYKGKIVLIDFWFTGCSGCIGMSKVLRQLERSFQDNPNVVFLNISVDKSRETWKNSIEEGRFTTGEGINLYTEGKGKDHEVIRKYNASSYPRLYLIDQNGNIVANPVPDPRKDKGKALTALINKQISEAHDGPYILYKNGGITVKYVTVDESGSIVLHTDSVPAQRRLATAFPVYTNEVGRTFNVKLKDRLENEPGEYDDVNKLFVLSDIEGNFDTFSRLLRMNGVIDSEYNWTFADGHLVLVGDIFDRGEQVTECLWLIYSLEEKARRAGGYVHFILGNHEVMNMKGNLRYVQDKYRNNEDIINEKYETLYSKNSELGRWLRTKNVIERVGNILFVHGGIASEVNKMPFSIDEINSAARDYLDSMDDESLLKERFAVLYNSKLSPFWYREYYEKDERFRASSQQIDSTLNKFKVDRIITGHTIVADTVNAHFNGKVINVDTRHALARSEALLIEDERYYRVNDVGERRLLFIDDEGWATLLTQ